MKKEDPNHGRLLGAHCSIAGGLANAAVLGGELSCRAIQIFTKNSNQWKAKPLTNKEVDTFHDALKENSIKFVLAHAGYLINLATVDPAVHADSMASMRLELERAEELKIPFVVVHPGSHKGDGEITGIMQIVENLGRLLDEFSKAKVGILLETTAGQGASIGNRFEHFADILDRLDWPQRLGICVDTAHIFAAGYDISTKAGCKKIFEEFDDVVGLSHIKAFHLNDSKSALASRVDRHEGLGKGTIGLEAFKYIMSDARFAKLPMVLETPKGKGIEEDANNLKLLRGFIK